jgi:integrase
MDDTITVKGLEKLTPADAGKRLSEGRGFYGRVLVSKAGKVSVSFYLRFRWGSKTPDLGCGSWPDTKLSKIRENADKARAVLATGVNPIEKRAEARTELKQGEQLAAATGFTVRQLFGAWRDAELIHSRKDGGAEPLRALEKDVFPVIGDKPASAVVHADCMAILDVIKARGKLATANKCLSYLNGMYEWAEKRTATTYVQANPLATISKKDAGGKENEGDRVLSEGEIHRLSRVIDSAGLRNQLRAALWVLLGTACRSNELLRAKRTDFDIGQRHWVIPKTNSKNTKPHLIYLSDFVLPHVQQLLDLSAGSEWLMPDADNLAVHAYPQTLVNATSDRQLAYYTRASANVKEYAHALELPGGRWTPHDLRRSAATHMGELDISPDVIEKVLNHVERNKVKRTYQRAVKFEQQCSAWRTWGARLQVITADSNIIPFSNTNQG